MSLGLVLICVPLWLSSCGRTTVNSESGELEPEAAAGSRSMQEQDAGGGQTAAGMSGAGADSVDAGAPTQGGDQAVGGQGGSGGQGGTAAGAESDPFPGAPEQYWETILQVERERLEECANVRADYRTGGSFGARILPTEVFIQAELDTAERAYRRGLDSGRLRFDAVAAGACLLRLREQSCSEYLRDLAFGDDCSHEQQVVGLVATGEYCENSSECESANDFCGTSDNTCPAYVCTPRAEIGESCAYLGCVPDAICPQVEPYICAPRLVRQQGESCGTSACDVGLFCSRNGVCRTYEESITCQEHADCPRLQVCLIDGDQTSGVCGPPREVGEACRPAALEYDDCSYASACRPGPDGSPVCTDTWAVAGQTCWNTGSRGGIVCIEGFCNVFDQPTQEGICSPFLAPGKQDEPCSSLHCPPGFDCTVDGCQPEPERCTRASCPEGSYCDFDACVPAIPLGEPCAVSTRCGNGAACIDEVCQACE